MLDVAIVRNRLSTYHGTPVPVSIARLVAWLASDPAHLDELEERTFLMPVHDLSVADDTAPLPVREQRRYPWEPPELIVFACTGTDGERIGVLELAPELAREELPFVTFFPAEHGAEICELGDDLASALAMYLAYPSVQGPKPLDLPDLFGRVVPAAVWNDFLPHAPSPPPGYRFVATSDRAGVLAPAAAFGPEFTPLERHAGGDAVNAAVESAARALDEGYPASAIAFAREARYVGGSGRNHAAIDRACDVWSRAALQLGRPWHAEMVGEIRRQNAEPRERTVYDRTTTLSVAWLGDEADAP